MAIPDIDVEDVVHVADGNIVLDYKLMVLHLHNDSEYVYFCPDGATFFVDEHDLQWVKFFPSNGYHKGKEHMMRTDAPGFMVVRDS